MAERLTWGFSPTTAVGHLGVLHRAVEKWKGTSKLQAFSISARACRAPRWCSIPHLSRGCVQNQ